MPLRAALESAKGYEVRWNGTFCTDASPRSSHGRDDGRSPQGHTFWPAACAAINETGGVGSAANATICNHWCREALGILPRSWCWLDDVFAEKGNDPCKVFVVCNQASVAYWFGLIPWLALVVAGLYVLVSLRHYFEWYGGASARLVPLQILDGGQANPHQDAGGQEPEVPRGPPRANCFHRAGLFLEGKEVMDAFCARCAECFGASDACAERIRLRIHSWQIALEPALDVYNSWQLAAQGHMVYALLLIWGVVLANRGDLFQESYAKAIVGSLQRSYHTREFYEHQRNEGLIEGSISLVVTVAALFDATMTTRTAANLMFSVGVTAAFQIPQAAQANALLIDAAEPESPTGPETPTAEESVGAVPSPATLCLEDYYFVAGWKRKLKVDDKYRLSCGLVAVSVLVAALRAVGGPNLLEKYLSVIAIVYCVLWPFTGGHTTLGCCRPCRGPPSPIMNVHQNYLTLVVTMGIAWAFIAVTPARWSTILGILEGWSWQTFVVWLVLGAFAFGLKKAVDKALKRQRYGLCISAAAFAASSSGAGLFWYLLSERLGLQKLLEPEVFVPWMRAMLLLMGVVAYVAMTALYILGATRGDGDDGRPYPQYPPPPREASDPDEDDEEDPRPYGPLQLAQQAGAGPGDVDAS